MVFRLPHQGGLSGGRVFYLGRFVDETNVVCSRRGRVPACVEHVHSSAPRYLRRLLCAPAMADPDPATGPANPAERPPWPKTARTGRDRRHRRETRIDGAGHADQHHGLERRRSPATEHYDAGGLVGKVPGISLRTAGPGQTEYEMRGLSAGGGTAATVGFYIDETPLSASAVALNGRTVIDPDLFDLNHVEVLRGPQGTLVRRRARWAARSSSSPINPSSAFSKGRPTPTVSETSHGSTNGGGSLMMNLPLGDIAALRTVVTAKYISGLIDRIVAPPGEFPAPTEPAGSPARQRLCAYYCIRGDVLDVPVQTCQGCQPGAIRIGASASARQTLRRSIGHDHVDVSAHRRGRL